MGELNVLVLGDGILGKEIVRQTCFFRSMLKDMLFYSHVKL